MTQLTSTISKTYAQSLIETGIDSSCAIKDLNVVFEAAESSIDLQSGIFNPSININLKYEIIEEIFKDKINDKIISFIKILVARNHFNELGAIIKSYIDLSDEKNNIKRAKIISAIELNEGYKANVIKSLEQKYNSQIIPEWVTNDEIIGGLVIEIDNKIIDNSLKRKLEKISRI